jgi:hypothetical protein
MHRKAELLTFSDALAGAEDTGKELDSISKSLWNLLLSYRVIFVDNR